MTDRLDDVLGFHQNALRLRSQRQAVLASNIANSDTPNYKARDLDFGKAMQAAMTGAGLTAAPELARSHPAHLASSNSQVAASGAVVLRAVRQNSADGNTVDLDVERSTFAENALRYEAGVTLVNAQIKGLLSVIQGG